MPLPTHQTSHRRPRRRSRRTSHRRARRRSADAFADVDADVDAPPTLAPPLASTPASITRILAPILVLTPPTHRPSPRRPRRRPHRPSPEPRVVARADARADPADPYADLRVGAVADAPTLAPTTGQVEVNSNWLIIPYGTHTRYFDMKPGVYRSKFMPFGSLFTKSETIHSAAYIKRQTMHMARLVYGISVIFKPFGFDASNAFRTGLLEGDPEHQAAHPMLRYNGDEFYTDYPHVMRKVTQEEGPLRLNDRDANLPYLCDAVSHLHLCTSVAQFEQLPEIVGDELCEKGEDRFVDYATRTGSGYFVAPWHRWFIGAPRLMIKDGGRRGSQIAYHNVGPITQTAEHYNLEIQNRVLLNKRSSKEHLLGKALPEQVLLDAHDRGPTVPMVLNVKSIPTESLAKAVSILNDGKRNVFPGTGPTPTGHTFPCGTKLFVNKVQARLQEVTQRRVADCEASHQGRGYRKEPSTSLKSFVTKHMSLSCVEKLADGTWICRCHDWQYFGHCPDAAVALELDGQIDVKGLLREVPANNAGGRPKKNASGRQRQPAPIDSRDLTLPPSGASSSVAGSSNGTSAGSPFTSRAGSGAKRKRSAPRGSHQPTGKQFLGKQVAKQFKAG